MADWAPESSFLWVYVDIFAVSAVVVGFVLIFGLICGGGCGGF